MSRLAPLIARRAALAPVPPLQVDAATAPSAWMDDLRLFLTGWVGGLIFFWTLLS